MKKGLFVVILIVIVSSGLFANITIFNKHKTLKKNGQAVFTNCNYCHNTTTKLDKKSGQATLVKMLYKKSTCKSRGCH